MNLGGYFYDKTKKFFHKNSTGDGETVDKSEVGYPLSLKDLTSTNTSM